MSSWRRVFGEDYEVPDEIENHPDLTDISYGNDACPSFMVTGMGEQQYTVWVGHPDPAAWEGYSHRFDVTRFNESTMGEPEPLFETNELARLLSYLKTNIPKWRKS